MIGIILLVCLYIVTLIVSIFGDTDQTAPLFYICMASTLAIPALIWIYTWLWGKMTGRHTIADYTPNQKEEASDDAPSDL